MNEELQEQLVKRFTDRFSKYNEKVLYELGQVIKQIGDVIPSDAYKLAQQLKYNTTIKELEKELAKITGKSLKEIRTILEHIAKENISFATPYYQARGLNVPIYEYHRELQKIVNSMVKLSSENLINISKNTGFKLLDINKNPMVLNLEETYQKVIDEALYAVTTGKDSYNQVTKDILKQLASSGVRNIEYESGHSRRIDTAVRMNILDSMRQVSNETSQQFGKEFGSDGVEISVHISPAPDHELIQGHQFSNEEFKKFQNHLDCYDYKGNFISHKHGKYDRRAVSEYNCYHYIFPIILGISRPINSDDELQKIIDDNHKGTEIDGKLYTKYEITQLQRNIETEIRKAKEQNIIASASGNEELMLSSQERITHLKNKYVQISKQINSTIDVDKIYVPGYKTVKIKKDISYKDVSQEWLDNANLSYKETANAVSIEKNGKDYLVNKTNKIEFLNREKENAEWFVSKFGGKIEFLPTIQEDGGVSCADYKYYPKKGSREWYFLEEKETNGKGKNVFYHALENKEEQAKVFLIDCTDSQLNDNEIYERIDRVFKYKETQYVETIIIKNNNDLFGVFKKK